MSEDFVEFPKIARLTRECVVTEKIDGTNASIWISDDGRQRMKCGSRSRWITPSDDNFGFARWACENVEELFKLGPGTHYGEWWGSGIQRGYGLMKGEKRFSLFNTSRWNAETKPACCSVVPMIYRGVFDTDVITRAIEELSVSGSYAAPGFMKPEGIVVYHTAAGIYFKKTIEKDAEWKGKAS